MYLVKVKNLATGKLWHNPKTGGCVYAIVTERVWDGAKHLNFWDVYWMDLGEYAENYWIKEQFEFIGILT